MRKKLTAFLLLALSCFAAFAQNAEKISALLETEEITKGQASYFVCVYQNLAEESITEDGAFWICKARGLFRDGESADEAISLDKACHLIARVSEMRGGLFYSIFRSARYTLREFKALDIVPSTADPQQKVSGSEFLALLYGFEQKGRTRLANAEPPEPAAAEQTEEIAEIVATERQDAPLPTLPETRSAPFVANAADFVNEDFGEQWLDEVFARMQEVLQGNPNVRFRVVGYVADFPNEIDDTSLSLERAERVARGLTERGIPAEKISVVSGGSTSGWGDELIHNRVAVVLSVQAD